MLPLLPGYFPNPPNRLPLLVVDPDAESPEPELDSFFASDARKLANGVAELLTPKGEEASPEGLTKSLTSSEGSLCEKEGPVKTMGFVPGGVKADFFVSGEANTFVRAGEPKARGVMPDFVVSEENGLTEVEVTDVLRPKGLENVDEVEEEEGKENALEGVADADAFEVSDTKPEGFDLVLRG